MTLEQRNDSILIRENSRDNSHERSNSTYINQNTSGDSNDDTGGSGSREPKRVKVAKIMPTFLGTKATLEALIYNRNYKNSENAAGSSSRDRKKHQQNFKSKR